MATFDATKSLDIRLKLSDFLSPTADTKKTIGDNNLLKAIIENQSVRMTDAFQGDNCTQKELIYLIDCDSAADCEVDLSTLGCDIPTGTSPCTSAVTVDDNLACVVTKTVSDAVCDNDYTFTELSSKAIQSAIEELRRSMCKKLGGSLIANASVNTYAGTEGTVAGTTTEYPSADFTDCILGKLMLDWQGTCGTGGSPIIVNGSNFYTDAYKAQFNASCCDSPMNSYSAHNMVWDLKLDELAGAKSTLVVDPSRIAFWTRGLFSEQPTLVDPSKGLWTWTIFDDAITYAEGGTQKPVAVNIRYQKKCTGASKNGVPTFDHCYQVYVTGGCFVAPALCDNCTGIMHFVAA